MNSMKIVLFCFAVACAVGDARAGQAAVHHDHPQRPPLLSTFNGVSPPGGEGRTQDSDPSIRTEILRDVPDANVFN